MRVYFGIPAVTGEVEMLCHQSMVMTCRTLDLLGIEHEEITITNCSDIVVARNSIACIFLNDPKATDLFFIDADLGFEPSAVPAILNRPEEIVAGIYPLKRDSGGYPVRIETATTGQPMGKWIGPGEQDYLIEAKLMPTGFMRIKREVFNVLDEHYPELAYDDDYVLIEGQNLRGGKNYFAKGIYDKTYRTEDFAFCQRWRDIGGKLWVYPNVKFSHVGKKAWEGNYHEYLLNLPGGQNSNIHKASLIEGWMSIPELSWLAAQAAIHTKIVEIGSWKGRSTRALADNTSGKVFAVDTFLGSAEHKEQLALSDESLMLEFMKNTEDLKNLRMYCASSRYAAETTPEDFDMIFIDAAHDYENVKADIQSWKPKLTPDGLLCGHDYSWPGVKQAVDELLPGAQVVPGTDIWFWRN